MSGPLRAALVALLALAPLSGCEDLPPPEIERVEPDHGPGDAETEIAIHGRHLDRVFEERGSELIAHPWSARLGAQPLERITWRSPERIDAVVPAGLTPGRHELVLQVEGRPEARLPDAFESR